MFLCKADKSLTVADAVNVSQSLFLERRFNRWYTLSIWRDTATLGLVAHRVHSANGSSVSILSLLEFGHGIKKERKKEGN